MQRSQIGIWTVTERLCWEIEYCKYKNSSSGKWCWLKREKDRGLRGLSKGNGKTAWQFK